MKKYNSFINENKKEKNDKILKYFQFDWDDNILIMPTVIHLEKKIDNNWIPTDVSTSEFAEIRSQVKGYEQGEESIWRMRNNSPDDTYSEFRDYGPRGRNAFIEDTLKAIKNNNFGPVWHKFIECLVGGYIFMIITARGHEPDVIKDAVEWIIFNKLNEKQKREMTNNLNHFNKLFGVNDKSWAFEKLIDNYLSFCDFIGVSSSYFSDKFNITREKSDVESLKATAIKYFVKKINNYGKQINRRIRVGFSDDDELTAHHVYKYMRDKLWYEFSIDYYVYYTKDGIKKLEERKKY